MRTVWMGSEGPGGLVGVGVAVESAIRRINGTVEWIFFILLLDRRLRSLLGMEKSWMVAQIESSTDGIYGHFIGNSEHGKSAMGQLR
jgi:hypothetical protein